eukprot:TRINITY_DN74204_c0_g1_i1.p1 TRINITY_DN74204_c0_g1~~TRINITY_DN74204_c0_g1_i1.p1  ORF type:complete len:220 (-),score=54.81 TRINITY_DN74204_c0_g1_i1:86-685(-)
MPVICIGPVCIPWSCLPAIVFFFWKFVKPLLPASWAAAIEKQASKVSDFCAPYLEKVPGFGKKKKKEPASDDKAPAELKFGEVGEITSQEHLDATLSRSEQEGFAVVLDFTAPWCKPCQAIKPRFKALAAEYASHCFLELNADDLDDVSAKCGVMGLPTFKVYKDGKEVGSVTGGDEAKMTKLLTDTLGTGSEKTKKGR